MALGRSTAISFTSRPEKVVPGSPQAIQINFLGTDLTVTPVTRNPGNLLVYTKSGRYVILFRIGNESNYDDVVRISAGERGRPVRLLSDSFQTIGLHIEEKPKIGSTPAGKNNDVTVLLASSGLDVMGPDLNDLFATSEPFRCKGCMVRMESDSVRLSCIKPITEIHCESSTVIVTIKRVPS